MSYASFIKNLPDLFSQPAGIAAIASLGIHGALGVILPLMPSQSQTAQKSDTPKPVGLVKLSPQDQNRLPQNPVPTPALPLPGALPPVAGQPNALPPNLGLGTNPLPPLGASPYTQYLTPGAKNQPSGFSVSLLPKNSQVPLVVQNSGQGKAAKAQNQPNNQLLLSDAQLNAATRRFPAYGFRPSGLPKIAAAPTRSYVAPATMQPVFPTNNPNRSIPATQPNSYSEYTPSPQNEVLPPPPPSVLPAENTATGDNPSQVAMGPNQKLPNTLELPPHLQLPNTLQLDSGETSRDTTYDARRDKLAASLFSGSMARRDAENQPANSAANSVPFLPSANFKQALAGLDFVEQATKRNPTVESGGSVIRGTIVSDSGYEGSLQGFVEVKPNGEMEFILPKGVSSEVEKQLANYLRSQVKPNTRRGFNLAMKSGGSSARNSGNVTLPSPENPVKPEQTRSPEVSNPPARRERRLPEVNNSPARQQQNTNEVKPGRVNRPANAEKPQSQSTTPVKPEASPTVESRKLDAGNPKFGINWRDRLRPSTKNPSLGDRLRNENKNSETSSRSENSN